ncbi:HsdM family class I SAM-dependent methyltransferase [Fibrella aquatilis]|uniref:site-specific DNA-methyltransferase (adenine-specific) n=1 Tax=Fibrella aquatilis TaxID=2817059 RepID=A0A939G8W1_9BACT|nr:N-6 DNA methylase [Fibrella aquatilis]MBO0932282.1 N-6 DNA methylase [Fibrella aquatilis]
MSINILQYESKVWATADLLIGAGIKQSDFPKYMMPFFALIMVESRLIREATELKKDFEDDVDSFIEEFIESGIGYNDYVIRQGKTLADICKNDKSFDTDFHAYLKSFDLQTRSLFGVDRGTEEEKFLDISGVSGQLKKKRVLFDTVKKWSEIDLTPFNNSEITTLEEHIKRKWADISAETAGEQYTPDDIIALIAELIADKLPPDNDRFLTIYDPTCGGGNLLFGVEDQIKTRTDRPTKTYGEDWSDSLYALAKIESRFRTDSDIRYGNTLTNLSFSDKQFDVVVANPPYGVDWKGYKADIENDQTQRFHDYPSISDGQFLFTQHILSQLDGDGLGVVVHNGSTLFSGDAGSGESNIRKWMLDNDWVEAIIQLPTDEFFNTGIYTYLWVFNKRKPADRTDHLMLINASELFRPLKKSKGKKRREMDPPNRAIIVQTLADFKDTDIARVFPKWHFYYNRQAIILTNVDDEGRSFEAQLPVKKDLLGHETRAKSRRLTPTWIRQTDESGNETSIIDTFRITTVDKSQYDSLNDYFLEVISPMVGKLDYREGNLHVGTATGTYWYDTDRETLMEESPDGQQKALGCGRIVIKSAYKKLGKKSPATIEITVELTPDYQKDYEVVAYDPHPVQNQQLIDAFMARYVTRPFRYVENMVGVELNFNKVFYQPETLRPIGEILNDLATLNAELSALENDLI